jgi:ABC-type multidrug transport system ATPase subunit
MKEILNVQNLTKKYGQKTVVDNLSFKVYEGDVFGFLGPNGAGKSTSIRMILSLIKKDAGKVEIEGYDIDKNYKKAMENVTAIVEYPSLYLNLSAYDNLKMIKNLKSEIPEEMIKEVIKIVGLEGRERDKASSYSLGMKQRLGIAMALVRDPKLILLDEPTNGLDPQGIIEIRELIKELASKYNKTVLVSSHQLHEIEMMCNRIVIIDKGKTMEQGDIKDLVGQSDLRVEVITKEKEKVKELVDSFCYGKFQEFTAEGVIVQLEKGESSMLINDLVKSDIKLDFVNNKSKTLEDVFIHIIEGEVK